MVKTFLRRVRRFLNAGVMDELAALRHELALARQEFTQREVSLVEQMEAALLAIALNNGAFHGGDLVQGEEEAAELV